MEEEKGKRPADGHGKTVIAEDVEIIGSVKCASDLRIDGKLNGDLSCGGGVVVGETAVVKGNLSVESVTILGQVNGNVNARDRIEIRAAARLTGDIKAKRLTVEDGVTFVGKSEVNPAGPASPSRRQAEQEPGAQESGAERAAEEPKPKAGGLFGKK